MALRYRLPLALALAFASLFVAPAGRALSACAPGARSIGEAMHRAGR